MAGYRIMIVDDDEIHRELLTDYLELAGYTTFEAGNGAEALDRIGLIAPDLVLLDVQMPELDGFETLRRLRQRREYSDLPVVFLTSHSSEHLTIRGLELGAEDYLNKPISNSMLLARVRSVLRRAQRYRRIEAALEGRLDDIGLHVLLQTFELSKQHVHIRLIDLDAEIELAGDKILRCRYGDRSGTSCLSRILLEERGRFTVDVQPVRSTSTDEEEGESIIGALLDAAHEVDEVVRKLTSAELTPKSRLRMDSKAGLVRLSALHRLSALPPQTVTTLLSLMDGSLRDNADDLVSVLNDGAIEVVE